MVPNGINQNLKWRCVWVSTIGWCKSLNRKREELFIQTTGAIENVFFYQSTLCTALVSPAKTVSKIFFLIVNYSSNALA